MFKMDLNRALFLFLAFSLRATSEQHMLIVHLINSLMNPQMLKFITCSQDNFTPTTKTQNQWDHGLTISISHPPVYQSPLDQKRPGDVYMKHFELEQDFIVIFTAVICRQHRECNCRLTDRPLDADTFCPDSTSVARTANLSSAFVSPQTASPADQQSLPQ